MLASFCMALCSARRASPPVTVPGPPPPRFRTLSLPPPDTIRAHHELYRGPNEYMNWAIPGLLLMGEHPASSDDIAHRDVLRRLLGLGIRTFVCLMREYNHKQTGAQKDKRGSPRPYIHDAMDILREEQHEGTLEMLHVPIEDGSIIEDITIANVAVDVCGRLRNGEAVYVHCWGGHGRTGTLVAIVLGMLFGLDGVTALDRTQQLHDTREISMGVECPQFPKQRDQVKRVLSLYRANMLVLRKSERSPFSIFKMSTAEADDGFGG